MSTQFSLTFIGYSKVSPQKKEQYKLFSAWLGSRLLLGYVSHLKKHQVSDA